MVAWYLLAYSFIRTVGRSAIFVSQWCILQAFVQAVMWHSTEPRTLGVSYWATGLFIGVACLPGLLYLLLSAAIPAKKSRKAMCRIGSLLIASVSPIILLCVSLPSLDGEASTRTILLGIGVLFMNLYMIVLSWTHGDISNLGSVRESQQQKPTCTNPKIFNDRAKKLLLRTFASSGIGSDALIAVFLTMSVRWYFFGVNVFYEDWRGPLVLTVIILIYAAALLVWEHSAVRNAKPTLAKWKLSKFDNNQATGGNNEERAEKASERDVGLSKRGVGCDLSNNEQQADAIEEGSGAETPKNGNICGVNHLVSPTKPKEENNIYSSCTGSDINTQRRGSKTSNLSAFLYAAALAPALGAISYTFLWIFTSPCILRLWGTMSDFYSEYVIFSCFTVGCLLAVMTNLEKICGIQYSDPNANEIKISQVKRLLVWQCAVNALLIVSMTLGASLTLLAEGVPNLFGAAVLCLTSPLLLRLLVVMSCDLLATTKSSQTLGERTVINVLPGVLFLVSGVTFAVFHLLGVMFINPQLTSIVHGKIGAVMVPQIVLALLPLVVSPVVKNKIKIRNQIRSPSMGPLLDSPAMKRQDEFEGEKSNKIFPAVKLWRIRQYPKISQIVLIVIVALSASLCKYSSQREKLKCNNSELTLSETCLESNSTSMPVVRVMSWNILLGHDMNGRNNLGAIADVVDQYKPDILGLQEATVHPPFWGGKDVFGYLQANTKSCREIGDVMDPRVGSFEVGMLSRFKILSKSSKVLPYGVEKKLPKYTMAKITCEVAPICNFVGELGSGSPADPTQRYKLHVYTLHAVYKNWTCETYSRLSCEQMQFVHEDVRQLPEDEPVIVMGDFNTNPSEPELDIWFQSDLGFKSAMWQNQRNPTRSHFSHACGENPIRDDETCNCDCRKTSSDPPATTILNRRAAVDHIFYRGLSLVGSAAILNQVGEVSDHYPVIADFTFE